MLPTPIILNQAESLSPLSVKIFHELRYFIVERERTSRRFLSSIRHPEKIESLHFFEIPEGKLRSTDIDPMMQPLLRGQDMGMMSEAGLPAIADPGNLIVMAAQEMGIKVIPIAGPSSLFMALMASGLEGQRFAFHGYLSAKRNELNIQLKELERRADADHATQMFIETPYRNNQVMEEAGKVLQPHRRFCIGAGIGDEYGFVLTKTMREWKVTGWPEIHKIPAVFLLR